jgi:hypothetical protein
MASNVKSSTTNQQPTRVQQYVDDQLEKTRRQVRSNDLIVACLTWAVAVAAFFLVLALIDAWVVSFSTVWRWVALITLILGSVAWFALAVVPLFLRRINLNYAAQMIEQATPDVKNSVLNYSLLRKRDEPMNAAVMDAVSRQAAEKLHSIPSDSTIDRSQLIRVGFILVGVMVFAVAYQLISPRDPLQTVQRILFPGQSIAKPASVQISKVTPGDARVFFGDTLQVTARVKGPHVPEDVRLVVSSEDGQITNFAIPMTADEQGREYQGLISPGDAGIQQPLRYRIEARDGVTPEYKIGVKANPSIAIETIELTPPTYTRLPKRTLVGRGDIEAIEGTEAMIFAIANLPIEVAYIEMLNAVPDDDPENPNATVMKPAAPPIEMRLLPDNRAVGRFNMSLNSNRTRQRATHYQIRFVSTDDERNESPNVYPIRVTPDLAPEVRIVQPRTRQTNIPANGQMPIRIEANDLDFAIDSVFLNMDHQGGQLLRKSLELISDNDNQRVNCRFVFEPSRYRLQAGDQIMFHAVASDNRISIKSLAADPNISQTENFTITITEPDPDAEPDQAQKRTEQDRKPPQHPDDRTDQTEPDQNSQAEDSGSTDQSTDETSKSESSDEADGRDNTETGDQTSENKNDDASGDESGSPSNDQPSPDGNQSPSNDQQGTGQEQNGGSAEQNQAGNRKNSNAEGRNERQNDGTSERGDPSGSSEGAGSEGGAEDSGSSGSNDPSDGGSGGSPDGGDQQGPPGTNQDDPNAQASGTSNQGGADGSQANGGTRSDPGNSADESNGDEGTRDRSLKDGQRERLPKDAHDGEKFEKLEELLKDQPPSDRSSEQSRGQKRPDRSNDQQPNGGAGQNERRDSDNPGEQDGGSSDQPSPDQKSDGNQGSGSQQSGDPNDRPSAGNNSKQGSEGAETPEGSQGEPSSSGSTENPGKPSEGQGENADASNSSSGSSGSTGDASDANQTPADSQPQPGSGSGTGQPGQPGETSPQPSDANSNGQQGETGDQQASSGQQGSGAGTDQPSNEQLQQEQADLEHAKKATDLILNKLQDQQQNPDPDLLDKMNWTEQDLREFLDRWNRMKQNAGTGDPNARKQYEEAIKSLGLRPDAGSRTLKNRDADTSGLNQDSSVIEPPADLAPEFNDFLRDRNRVR